MLLSTNGLVIKECETGENDRLLVLLTPEYGQMTAVVKGGRSINSKNRAASQLFSYSNFELYKKGDFSWVRESMPIDVFYGLRDDIMRLSLASYICDVLCDITVEQSPDVPLLRLALNTFHLLAKSALPISQLKSVFELRAASYLGFMPDLHGCARCGRKDGELFYLDVMGGHILCPSCLAAGTAKTAPDDGEAVIIIPVDMNVLCAMRYVISALPEKVFSFRLSEDTLPAFGNVCEKYLLNHIERGFDTLEFYKSLLKDIK